MRLRNAMAIHWTSRRADSTICLPVSKIRGRRALGKDRLFHAGCAERACFFYRGDCVPPRPPLTTLLHARTRLEVSGLWLVHPAQASAAAGGGTAEAATTLSRPPCLAAYSARSAAA